MTSHGSKGAQGGTFARRHPWLLSCIALVVGFSFGYGYFLFHTHATAEKSETEIREFNAVYQYISPLIACSDADESLSNQDIKASEESVARLIAGLTSQGKISEAAVYFRELDGGGWFGINHEVLFTPGSLLKVPLVMSVYKHAETEPGFTTSMISLPAGGTVSTYEPHFRPRQSIEAGGTYSVEDLIRASLVFSDNNAVLLLGGLLPLQEIINTYTHLGVESPDIGADAKMSVRTYASFFRILYNASYISRDYSEKMLDYLAQSEFRQGLVAGVPANVVVAHKFGERERDAVDELQLHDCGIVYHDPKPYVLCVMTRGQDFNLLADAIQQISATVYKAVDES